MALKLMYITNNPEVALIAEEAGVDRIFVDLEYIGKADRQGGMDTVQSHHTIDDISKIRCVLKKSELLVRCNPIHNASKHYCSSKEEIDSIVEKGADIIMLPFFKNVSDVQTFLNLVNGRAKTMLLVETPEAVEMIDEIISLPGIDSIHIGLNDLSLGYHMRFMFELLTNGVVEMLCDKFRNRNIKFGFGGIASLGKGTIPAEMIIMEHYRLGSSCAILSRSFCNTNEIKDLSTIKSIFENGLRDIRLFEESCEVADEQLLMRNHDILESAIQEVLNKI